MSDPDQLAQRALPARVELRRFAQERADGEAWLAEAAAAGRTALTLDLTAVAQASSLLVALLIALLRRARTLGLRLEFVAVPATVQAIIEFSGLETLLPAAAPGPGRAPQGSEDGAHGAYGEQQEEVS